MKESKPHYKENFENIKPPGNFTITYKHVYLEKRSSPDNRQVYEEQTIDISFPIYRPTENKKLSIVISLFKTILFIIIKIYKTIIV